MEKEISYRKVLDLVNQARTVLELEPLTSLPKGIPFDTLSCPIAQSLYHKVTNYGLHFKALDKDKANAIATIWGTELTSVPHLFKKSGWIVTLPIILKSFIQEFDRGDYPDIIGDN